MNQSATCKKVSALLALYIDNKLDPDQTAFVTRHLEVCPDCYKKFVTLKTLIGELRLAYKDLISDSKSQEKKLQFNIKEYENFKTNLSSYFDNELPINESVNMKKYMIKFPNARKSLEEMYSLHKIITTSVSCVKKTYNTDYSRKICYLIQGKSANFKRDLYLKVASFSAIFVFLSLLIVSTMPVGKTVIDKGIKFFKKTIYVQAPQNNEIASELQ